MRNKLNTKIKWNKMPRYEIKKKKSKSLKIKINRNFKNEYQNWHKYKMTWNHIWFLREMTPNPRRWERKEGGKEKKKVIKA